MRGRHGPRRIISPLVVSALCVVALLVGRRVAVGAVTQIKSPDATLQPKSYLPFALLPRPTATPTLTPTSSPTPTATPSPTPPVWHAAGLDGRTVRTFAAGQGVLYAGSEAGTAAQGGVYRTNACTPGWTESGLQDKLVFALAHAVNGTLFAGTYGDGMYRSTDSGVSWQPANTGLNDNRFYGLAAHPGNAALVLAAGYERGIFRSTDGGASWRRSPPAEVSFINTVTFDPFDGSRAYAGSDDKGLYKSVDAGASFFASNNGLANTRLWVIRVAAETPPLVYAGTSDGLFRSRDRGLSWQRAGLTGKEVRSLAVHPHEPDHVFAGTRSDGVWETRNGGATWQALNANLPAGRAIYALYLDVDTCRSLLAGTSNGVFLIRPGL